jgi:hypothetical protein
MTTNFKAVLFLFLMATASLAAGQNCSAPHFQLTSETQTTTGSCSMNFIYIDVTRTYSLSCTYTSGNIYSGQTYWTGNTSVTGHGQCFSDATGTNYCPPILTMSSTTATSASDYNRFYNQAQDYTASTVVGQPCSAAAWRQDFKQCTGQSCNNSCRMETPKMNNPDLLKKELFPS